jgi:hypothetical protein
LSKSKHELGPEQTIELIEKTAVGAMGHVRTLGERVMAVLVAKAKGGPFTREVIVIPGTDYASLSLPFFCHK